jgi:hypothetical protein
VGSTPCCGSIAYLVEDGVVSKKANLFSNLGMTTIDFGEQEEKQMKLNKEQIDILINTFEELNEELSFNNHGTLFTEQWELYNLLKENGK